MSMEYSCYCEGSKQKLRGLGIFIVSPRNFIFTGLGYYFYIMSFCQNALQFLYGLNSIVGFVEKSYEPAADDYS